MSLSLILKMIIHERTSISASSALWAHVIQVKLSSSLGSPQDILLWLFLKKKKKKKNKKKKQKKKRAPIQSTKVIVLSKKPTEASNWYRIIRSDCANAQDNIIKLLIVASYNCSPRDMSEMIYSKV